MDFWQVLGKRHSIRAFLQKIVEEEKLKKILEVTNSAPSAGNLQAYEIYLIKDKKIKDQLAQASCGQDFISQAPVVLVFFANPARSGIKYGPRGENLYCLQDATIAATFAWLAAVDQGLATVWVGAFEDSQVKRICGADFSWQPVAILPIGYPAETPTKKSRRQLSDLVHKI